MLRRIRLYGSLQELAGIDELEFDVDSPVGLVCAFRSQLKGFRNYCDHHKLAFVLDDGEGGFQPILMEDFELTFGRSEVIHVVPETEGAGVEWATVVSWVGSYGAIATAAVYIAVNVAIAVVAGAVMQALAPKPKMGRESTRPEENPSFVYNGPINVVEQGYCVPLVYGMHMASSVQVSAGVKVEEIGYVPIQEPVAPGVIPREIPTVPWQWGL